MGYCQDNSTLPKFERWNQISQIYSIYPNLGYHSLFDLMTYLTPGKIKEAKMRLE